MKHAVTAIMVAFALSGCVTTGDRTPLQVAAQDVTSLTWRAASFDMNVHPERVTAYRLARKGLAQMLINETIDPVAVSLFMRETLQQTEIKNPNMELIFGVTSMILLNHLGGGATEIQSPEQVRTIATALKNGLDLALLPYEPKAVPNG